jgi:hypothetical protein
MSFIGYGNIYPNSNVNPHYANVAGVHSPAMLSSDQIPGQNGLPGLYGTKSNIASAAGIYTKSMVGGKMRRKINNLRSMYKRMAKKGGKMMTKRTRRTRTRTTRRTRSRRGGTRKHRMMRGGLPSNGGIPSNYGYGFSQGPYQVSYGLGGNLPPSQSALAQPMYYKANYEK